ncbi:amino acid adenylation domain-containing protein [Pyxidicoccus fallax]|uniref:Amino acid adenylation domain-containing protein n=1 Tax=Pyxidicoccus fallax TaxID=394095 RepID=A0A848L8L8_9BACT|nr:amino acid adenylation domain-containing protein [Pyxidicoccus fallax]NMO15159.1 amino acid adenylation domain-containing protein [Pyxidicoccus fallax]NPC77781.1 amino acid adenylation domain-containing protein [Pyxidicoccus fallax]
MTTQREHPRFARPEPVHRLFAEQAKRTPSSVAVASGNTSVTYEQLSARARALAATLRRQGVGPGSRVGILLTPSIELVIAVLGCLEAGAAYVPLEPLRPLDYTKFVIENAGVSLVLTQPELGERLRGLPVRCISPTGHDSAPSDAEAHVSPEDAAYVIYTSGTTGNPKGVLVPHRALASYIGWARELYVGNDAATFPLYSSLAFDLTVTSLFVPLVSGGTLIAYPGSSAGAALMDAIEDNRVDTVKLTPSHLSLLVTRKHPGSRVRRLIVGGESLDTRLARQALESFGPGLELFNEYGPTEATVGCIVHRFNPGSDVQDFVPIGRPAPNARAWVLDERLTPVAEGVTGELYLGGDCLALGYLGNPEATRERFVPSPFEKDAVLYRTGDLARWLPGERLGFEGRNDSQIKFNGHRVELEGLRSLLNRHPAVRDSVVLLGTDAGASALIAYYASEQAIDASALRSFLGTQLSQELLPQYFVHVARWPLTPNGKVDTKALPRLDEVKARMRSMSAPPRTPTETELAAIWRRSLGLAEIGVDDDFFEMGGHSLLANQIILRIREALGVDLNMRSIFENRTVAALARSIEQARANAEIRIATGARTEEAPLPRFIPGPGASTTPAAATKKSDEENLVNAESITSVDEKVGEFYSRFPWPWNSSKFDTLQDPDFERTLVSQEVGDFGHTAVPRDANIWVAGCGTNQALLTALLFPNAKVLGTDLSTKSIEICAANAADLGVKNLELRLESINDAPYVEQFDFIVCTGVIHHTYEPAHALARLSRALKRDGLMELLVYNRFHRTITSAFQKAIRLMTQGLSSNDYAVAKRLAAGFAVDNTMARFISRHRDWEESDFADLLINPVEHSYTVDSLADMAGGCNLELVRPCISLYAKYRAESIFWEMGFTDPDIQRVYDAMPDLDRWRVSNLLMHEKSPMLWFYLRRQDSLLPRKSEQQLNDAFLKTTFERASTMQQSYIRGQDGRFRLSSKSIAHPASAPEDAVRALYERFDRPRVMGEVFSELGLPTHFGTVQRARLQLTIPAFPYLKAVGSR